MMRVNWHYSYIYILVAAILFAMIVLYSIFWRLPKSDDNRSSGYSVVSNTLENNTISRNNTSTVYYLNYNSTHEDVWLFEKDSIADSIFADYRNAKINFIMIKGQLFEISNMFFDGPLLHMNLKNKCGSMSFTKCSNDENNKKDEKVLIVLGLRS